MDLNDFEQFDCLMGFAFLHPKDANEQARQNKSIRYKVVAINPEQSNDRYHMLLTYIMYRDQLIEFIRTTDYRIISITKLHRDIFVKIT